MKLVGTSKASRQIRREEREIIPEPGGQLAIDFHDSEPGFGGYKCLMLITDRWTGFMWDYYLTDHTAETILSALEGLFANHPPPTAPTPTNSTTGGAQTGQSSSGGQRRALPMLRKTTRRRINPRAVSRMIRSQSLRIPRLLIKRINLRGTRRECPDRGKDTLQEGYSQQQF